MATFNGMDYAIFILLFLSVAIGTARGFVKEVISLLAWVAAFTLATLYAVKLAIYFTGGAEPAAGANSIESLSMAAIIISYLAIFFGVLICGSILKWIVNRLVEGSGLGVINRLFGAVFGFARGCVIVLIVLYFLAFTALTTHTLWKDSKLVPIYHPAVAWMSQMTQPYLSQVEDKLKNTTKNLNQEDMSDVIKTKPAGTAPAAVVPVVTPKKAP